MNAIDAITGIQKWVQSSPKIAYDFTLTNGKIYAQSLSPGHVYVLDAKTGLQEKDITVGGIPLSLPCFADGNLYIGISKSLYAFDANSGSAKWSFLTTMEVQLSPVIVDKIVYMTNGSNSLYALDATTGKQKWRFDTPEWSIHRSPVIIKKNGDVIYPNNYLD